MPSVSPLDADVRADLLPATASVVYLNTGSAGPLLRPVQQVMSAALQHEALAGRSDNTSWEAFLASRAAVRQTLGELVGAKSSEIVLTHHTTEGLNIALWGFEWKAGDRIAVTSLEHDAGIAAVHTLAKRFGLVVDVVDCGFGATEDVLQGLRVALEKGPKLLLMSHVAWSTGAVLPIKEAGQLARESGCAVLVDGAQAVGAVPVDVTELDADFYSFNGYKWLCGPEGSGALVVRERWLEELIPSFGGAFGVDGSTVQVGDVAGMKPAAGAARYESGSWFRPSLLGLVEAVRWFADENASGGGTAQVGRQAAACRARLVDELGATVRTPDNGTLSGLVDFTLPGHASHEVASRLEAAGVVIRSVPVTGGARVSCAAFTTDADIDALISALRLLMT